MPLAGRQFEPTASIRMTNWNRRLLVVRLVLKKMPPKKGLKKRSMMASEKPSACASTGTKQCVGRVDHGVVLVAAVLVDGHLMMV